MVRVRTIISYGYDSRSTPTRGEIAPYIAEYRKLMAAYSKAISETNAILREEQKIRHYQISDAYRKLSYPEQRKIDDSCFKINDQFNIASNKESRCSAEIDDFCNFLKKKRIYSAVMRAVRK